MNKKLKFYYFLAAAALLVIIAAFVLGMRVSLKPGSIFNPQTTQPVGAVQTAQPGGAGGTTGGGAGTVTTAPVTSGVSIIKDDMGHFWLITQGKKHLLSPSAYSQEKANLLNTVDYTGKKLSAVACAEGAVGTGGKAGDQLVSLNYDLFLLKNGLKYKLSYSIKTGSYAGAFPTSQVCMIPEVQ